MNRLVVQLQRLEKAAAKPSHTNRKLIDAAHETATLLAAQLGPQTSMNEGWFDLPRDYRLIASRLKSLPRFYLVASCEDEMQIPPRVIWQAVTREGAWQRTLPLAQRFAHDISTGWLNEVAEIFSLQWES